MDQQCKLCGSVYPEGKYHACSSTGCVEDGLLEKIQELENRIKELEEKT